MSGRLVTAVLESALQPSLIPVAVALASLARDDGTRLFPSVAHVAWLSHKSERRTQVHMAALRASGVLVVVRRATPSRPAVYRFEATALPVRSAWNSLQPELPFVARDGMHLDPVPVDASTQGGVTFRAGGVTPATPLPEISTDVHRHTHDRFDHPGVSLAVVGVTPATPDPLSGSVRDPLRTEEPARIAPDPPDEPQQATLGPLDVSRQRRWDAFKAQVEDAKWKAAVAKATHAVPGTRRHGKGSS